MCTDCKQLADVVASSNAQAAMLRAQREARVLQINSKSVYGKTLYYPGNQAAELIAKIAGAKTLSPAQISYAEQLGFSINYNVVL